jgi:methylenetetrahydrofolate/methylenetetrahydromethanopterin dehydrogenase (NADP+)
MADKRRILIQLDTDAQPSVFDRVVAVDSGADELFSYGGVKPDQVRDLVHGAIFTRGVKDLRHTAVFIGGSDVAAGERLLEEVQKHLLPQFGLTVSVLLDSNGANTTAAAAVRAAARHLDLSRTTATVLGGTGPVGQRVALLLARQGADVRVGSRQMEKAAQVCAGIRQRLSGGKLGPVAAGDAASAAAAVAGRELVVAAGATGVVLLSKRARQDSPGIRVLIDLNAVPPLGIEGVEVMDKAAQRDGAIAYGAIGVGDTKMKVHKAAVAKLFEANNLVLDVEEVYQIACNLA